MVEWGISRLLGRDCRTRFGGTRLVILSLSPKVTKGGSESYGEAVSSARTLYGFLGVVILPRTVCFGSI